MNPYEIMLSESQERMLLVAQKGREAEVFRVFEKWGLDAVEIGHVIAETPCACWSTAKLWPKFPTPRSPTMLRYISARWNAGNQISRVRSQRTFRSKSSGDFTPELKQLLSSPNICSKRWVWQQYDHMVQTNTVEAPGAGDAGVIRIKGAKFGLAMALDGNSRWCYLDPKLGAMHAVAEATRNVACAGGVPVGATNCLNFGNPEKPHIMWQFSQAIDGITKACEELDVPITGGNVSLYNETLGEGIYPTPVMGIVGIIEDVAKAVRPSFKEANRAIVLLSASESGDATDAEIEFGSSEYAKEFLGSLWGFPPALELEREAALQKAIIEMAQADVLDSAHDIAEGGIAVTLAECAFEKGIGFRGQPPGPRFSR